MTLLFFSGVAVLLTVEGRWLVAAIARENLTRSEEWALGFPMGTFANALLFFICTVGGIPLNALAVFGGHLGIVIIAFAVSSRVATPSTPFDTPSLRLGLLPPSLKLRRTGRVTRRGISRDFNFKKYLLPILLTLAILIKLFYGISHALLPSYSYDTVSQWNMRAKISYEDRAIAFDRDEVRGMSKPQYPILFHSLQIVFNLPQKEWQDPVANGATLLLSLTSFLAFFLLLRRLAGSFAALVTLACILTIPLLSIHLAQGYGDIHVLTYVLLGAVLLLHSFERNQGNQGNQQELLLLSAIFVAASAWVKQEGMVFGVVPWMVIVGIGTGKFEGLKVGRFRGLEVLKFGGLVFLLSLPWTLFLLIKELPLSPHGGGDLMMGWHPEGVPLALKALFAGGSFGMHWYIVIGLLLSVLFERVRRGRQVEKSMFLIFLWGIITFFGALFIFLCTSNIEFLMNAQTFSRTMLLPLSLLILGTVPLFYYNGSHDAEGGSRS